MAYGRLAIVVISDEYQFAFIHIPKCAGSSIRIMLQDTELMESAEFYWGVAPHAALGMVDYAHIPLFALRKYFEGIFEKVERYQSFALIRDPFERFRSSISQRAQAFGEKSFRELDSVEIDAEVRHVIDYLSAKDNDLEVLPPEYIHFQRQVDFLYLDGKRIVDVLLPVDAIEQFVACIGHVLGCGCLHSRFASVQTINRSLVYRNWSTRVAVANVRRIADPLKKVLPPWVIDVIRNVVYVHRDSRIESVFEQRYVREFVHDYYHSDLEMFARNK